MLKDFKIRFFDNKSHKKGIIVVLSAIDLDQAYEFATLIVEKLKENSDWDAESVAFQ